MNGTQDYTKFPLRSGNEEWNTPESVLWRVRYMFEDGIDLDPATNVVAQENIKAKEFFTEEEDGLKHDWIAKTLFLNPPYANKKILLFTEKLLHSFKQRHVERALLLVNNATETKWCQKVLKKATGICFPSRRIRFLNGNEPAQSPIQGQIILYFSHLNDYKKFEENFTTMGFTVRGKNG